MVQRRVHRVDPHGRRPRHPVEEVVVVVARRLRAGGAPRRAVAAAAAAAAARADVEARPAILPSGAPITLSDEQGSALELAASRSLAMISGGPGTGKTSIVVALLRVLVRIGISIDAIELAAVDVLRNTQGKHRGYRG